MQPIAADTLRMLGAHLEEVGVAAGSYDWQLTPNVLRPMSSIRGLIAKLHEQLSSFDQSIVLGGALTQLECTNCHRWWEKEKTAYRCWNAKCRP